MNRTLCLLSLLLVVMAVVILSQAPETEAKPRFGRGGAFGGLRRKRVKNGKFRRRFSWVRFRRRGKYYKTKPKPTTTMAATTTGAATTTATTMTTAPTTMTTMTTVPPTMCVLLQQCSSTNQLSAQTNGLYSNLLSNLVTATRANAQETFDELPDGGDCGIPEVNGDVVTVMLNPGSTGTADEFMLQLLLNAAGDRILQVNLTSRNFDDIGRLRVGLVFAGGEDIQEDPENLLQTNLEIMPPGTTTFFPFPVLLTECELVQECGVGVTPQSPAPTDPVNLIPDPLPAFTTAQVTDEILEVISLRCSDNTVSG